MPFLWVFACAWLFATQGEREVASPSSIQTAWTWPPQAFDVDGNGTQVSAMARAIYLDNHSTTPLDPRVLERMLPFMREEFGNAASKHHRYGWFADEAVQVAREQLATLIGASEREIVFTSGATESNNIAIQGVARAYASKGRHVVTQATEHKAVLDVFAALAESGFEVTVLPVDAEGRVDPDALEGALRDDTILVSLMSANNEVGTIHDLETLGALCRERGVLVHSDAAQSVGKLPIDLASLPVDLLSVSGHKLYGPKGVGALYLRRRAPRVRVEPIVFGGGHERGVRSGTLNVPAIVGLGVAAELAAAEMHDEAERLKALRDDLEARVVAIGGIVNGPSEGRLFNNLNISFPGVDADALLVNSKEIAASTGSACTSASLEPSHVLRAMGLSRERCRSAVRFGVGRFNTADDMAQAAEVLERSYRTLAAA